MDTNIMASATIEPDYKRIRALRRHLEVSQLDVALIAGISQSQYSLFEHGHVRLGTDVIKNIQEFLQEGELSAGRAGKAGSE